MADKTQLPTVVMTFAGAGTIVTRPQTQTDRIFPALSDLSDGQFQSFHTELARALRDAGFSLDLPFQELRDCKTWTHVIIVLAAQV